MLNCSSAERSNKIMAFYLFALFASMYLLTAAGPVESDVGQLRNEVAKSIVERLDVSVPAGMGVRGADGRDYSWFSIGSVFAALPFYLFGNLTGTPPYSAVSVMNQLVAASTALLVFFFVVELGYSRYSALSVSILYGFGTMSWYYAKEMGDHILETFWILLCIYYMYRYVSESRICLLLLSGIALGAAFLTRPTSVLVMPSLLILRGYHLPTGKIRDKIRLLARDSVLLFLAVIPFLGVACWYNDYRFGSPFETGYTLIAERLGLDFFTGTSLLKGLAGFLVSPGKGFFYYSPIAILFFFSIIPFRRKHKGVAACFVLIMLSYLIFLSRNIYWHGDWAWGPRYLLVITPLLMIPVAATLDSAAWRTRHLIRKGIYFLFIISILIQISAISVNHNKYFIHLQTVEGVEFSVVRGQAVQPIVEPPEETYFNWSLSPILKQFIFMHEISENLKKYRYTELPDDAPLYEKVRSIPALNVYDFWWLYKYHVEGVKAGFAAAAALLLLSVYCAARIAKVLVS